MATARELELTQVAIFSPKLLPLIQVNDIHTRVANARQILLDAGADPNVKDKVYLPSRNWTKHLSSKVHLSRAIDFKALCSANLVTLQPIPTRLEYPHVSPVGGCAENQNNRGMIEGKPACAVVLQGYLAHTKLQEEAVSYERGTPVARPR